MTESEIDDVCLKTYRARLDDPDRQVRDDKDNGQLQRRRALQYRPLVIEVLIAAGVHARPVRAKPGSTQEALA